MNRERSEKYLRWDIDAWKVGLEYILNVLPPARSGQRALELGANYGGISVALVTEKGYETICSDIDDPKERVLNAHPEAANPKLSFDTVDGLNIKYSDSSFDVVIFKSVIGFLALKDLLKETGKTAKELQQQFINEIYRVLKPGGYFCFMENGKSSFFHQYARNKFVTNADEWRYVTIADMNEYTARFSQRHIHAYGFFTAFARSEDIKKKIAVFDKMLMPFVPETLRYVTYGYAIK